MRVTTLQVQQALIALGYDLGKGGKTGKGDDGRKGPKYDAAVRSFQTENGLLSDGLVGQLTKDKLFPEPMPERDKDLPQFPPSQLPDGYKPMWPLQRECMGFYGGVGLHQTILELPYPMRIAWGRKPVIRKFAIHQKCHDSAKRAFEKVASIYGETARENLGIDLFGGCLNVRKMRGGSSYSMHSWGIAIDFDPERNQLKWDKRKARLGKPDAEEFWRAWEAEGWVSLGRAAGYDFMHVQAARLR